MRLLPNPHACHTHFTIYITFKITKLWHLFNIHCASQRTGLWSDSIIRGDLNVITLSVSSPQKTGCATTLLPQIFVLRRLLRLRPASIHSLVRICSSSLLIQLHTLTQALTHTYLYAFSITPVRFLGLDNRAPIARVTRSRSHTASQAVHQLCPAKRGVGRWLAD